MITAYCSSFIRCLVATRVFSEPELMRIFVIDPGTFERIIAGSNTDINLNHINRITNLFGMAVMEPSFFHANAYKYGKHDSTTGIELKDEIGKQFLELQAYNNTRNPSPISQLLSQVAHTNSYLNSCEFILAEVAGVPLEPELEEVGSNG